MWNLFLQKKERSLQSFKLILTESRKYELCNIVLFKLIAYSLYAYTSLQKTKNRMVKHIARSHSLGSCGQEVLLSQTGISPGQPHASEANRRTKFNRRKSSNFSFT